MHRKRMEGLTFWGLWELSVYNLVSFGEVLDDVFIGEDLGYVFDDGSAYEVDNFKSTG